MNKVLRMREIQLGASSQIYRNATGHVTGYGGVFYEELSWISLRLNFRCILFKRHKEKWYNTLYILVFSYQFGYGAI